jgi:hypothetical protein
MESWGLCKHKSRVGAVSSPGWVARSEEMAPSAAALAATALIAATFPSCSRTVHSSQTACARARVGGKVVCVKAGERCSARYEQIYRSYALTCRKGILRERDYIGPANP